MIAAALLAGALGGCGDDGVAAATTGGSGGSFILPGDPCMRCTLGDGDEPDCAPVAAGAACGGDDCCAVGSTCEPCSGGDCPASGLRCRGGAADTCEDTTGDPCATVTPTCEDGTCACARVDAPDGTACDDADPCTDGDSCVAGACEPGEPLECPSQPCATAVQCDPTVGRCLAKLAPDGSACDTGSVCEGAGRCRLGRCEADDPAPCDDDNPCTADRCDQAASETSGQRTCLNEPAGDGAVCDAIGACQGGACQQPGDNQPPTAPRVAIEPTDPAAGAGLTCRVTEESTDPEGQEVTYVFAWLREGQDTEFGDPALPAGVTAPCETWTCAVIPRAGGFPGPLGAAAVTTRGDPGDAVVRDPVFMHSWPPAGGTFSNWGAGEAFATLLTIPPAELPYTIGRLRAALPANRPWTPTVWADRSGSPGAELATSQSPTTGTGGGLQDAPLDNPVTVTDASGGRVWIGFISNSGGVLSPAGPIAFDGDGAQTSNYIFGSYIGFGATSCSSPCWLPATEFDGRITDWVVEAAPPDPGACP